jgi:uncharacterized protein with HEPN domain
MSKRDIKLLIEDIELASSKINKYILGLNFETFLEDDKTIDALLEI